MKLPLLAFLIFLAIAVVWVARDRETQREVYPRASSLSTGDDGASLARAYLERTGVRVRTLAMPLGQAELPRDAIVLRIDPDEEELSDDDREFVKGGGRLVLALEGDSTKEPEHKVSPLLPMAQLDAQDPRTLPKEWLVDAQPVFERGELPSLARVQLGRGDLWLISEPELLENELLNLPLLTALCAGSRTVYFDEAAHGIEHAGGTLELLGRWGMGPALLLACLALLAIFWRRAKLLGPPADKLRDLRSDAVELVDSLAALYQGALTRAEALRLYRQRIVREIALRLALDEKRATAVLDGLAERDAEIPRLSKSEFTRRLHGLVSACERFRNEHRRSR